MGDIKFVCNRFKEVRITVGSTDTLGRFHENGTSTSVQLGIRETGKGFPSRSLRLSTASAWDSKSAMTRCVQSGRVKIILPTCLSMHFLNWNVFS